MRNAQNSLDTFPRNFNADGKFSNLLVTSRCNGIWESWRGQKSVSWKTTGHGLLLQTCCGLVVYVADLLRRSRQPVADLLRGNWCNGFSPLRFTTKPHRRLQTFNWRRMRRRQRRQM